MKTEFEAKFLNVDHDVLRARLQDQQAVCQQPSRLMRRSMFDYADKAIGNSHARLRVRDEGDKVTVTYKTAQAGTPYDGEIETTVGSFEAMVALLEAIGLHAYSYQESKRETWHFQNCEVVLDEWPWLATYIEIEGPSEAKIKQCAAALGFDWQVAEFGDVDKVYMQQYPGMQAGESIGQVSRVCFDQPLPRFLRERQS